MAMADAFRFLTQCRTSPDFRGKLYPAGDGNPGTGDSFRERVSRAGYRFSDAELEDAIRSLQLRAADEYDADEIRELGQWYRFMGEDGHGEPEPESADTAGGRKRAAVGSCPPGACSSCSICR